MSRKHQGDIDATIALLAEQFPKTFFVFQARRLPLKLGIREDIIAILGDAIEPKMLGQALKYYTHNYAYRLSQKVGRPRIDLDGEPSGSVSEEDALGAAKCVAFERERIKALQAAKGKAKATPVLETPAPPPPAPEPPPPPARLGLSALREAARLRKQAALADQIRSDEDDQSAQRSAS